MTAKYEATVVTMTSKIRAAAFIKRGKSAIFPHSHAASNCDMQSLQKPCDEAFTCSQKSIFSNKFNVFVSKVGAQEKRQRKRKRTKTKTTNKKCHKHKRSNQQNQERRAP
jgi:hypothetical protein